MQYLITSIFVGDNSIIENYFDKEVVKELAFNAKIKTATPDGKKDITYDYILIPVLELPEKFSDEELLLQSSIGEKIYSEIELSSVSQLNYSVAELFKTGNRMVLDKILLDIHVLGIITDADIGITYSDGSFKKSTSEASYGVAKLLTENETGSYDAFTGKKYLYETFSEKVAEGTNNIGELSGLKAAINHFGDAKYQVIISDSEYSIKAFREWYYNWKTKGYKNYAGKSISNKDLIKGIVDDIDASGKIILFKWTKGHDNNDFNDICDIAAKKVLGL